MLEKPINPTDIIKNYECSYESVNFIKNNLVENADDTGTVCLSIEEFEKLNIPDSQFINDRVSEYYSPRNGKSVALRSESYWRMLTNYENPELTRDFCYSDLNSSLEFLKANNESEQNSTVNYILLEYLKNDLLRIQYAMTNYSISSNEDLGCELAEMNATIQQIWDNFLQIIIEPNTKLELNLDLRWVSKLQRILDPKDFIKLRELDSPKTLLQIVDRICKKRDSFDVVMPLMYGGAELPYAYNSVNSIVYGNDKAEIVPCVFSTNRVKKGKIKLSSNLSTQSDFQDLNKIVVSSDIEKITNAKNILILDNNITTGFSLKEVDKFLQNNGKNVKSVVPEVNAQEMSDILNSGKEIDIKPSELYVKPLGDYIACYGLDDSSRMVDRIKFLTGNGEYSQMIGYDFDETIANTGKIHKEGWNYALAEMGFGDVKISQFPNNSGKTFLEVAKVVYERLQPNHIDEHEFVRSLIKLKMKSMKNADHLKTPLIARTMNTIEDRSKSDQQIIVTNNRLDYLTSFLEARNLTRHFTHVICEDKALNVKTGEIVIVRGQSKPSASGYLEVAKYFDIPRMITYYGDRDEFDGVFAAKIGADYVNINHNI